MITLYQFPISHYCEKIRWALSYKGLKFQTVNLIPGFHIKKMKQLTGKSSVPAIIDNKRVIYNSSNIIDYLDKSYPTNPLSSNDMGLQTEIMNWEQYIDDEIGVHVRRICYHTLLDYPALTTKFLTHNCQWYAPFLIKLIFPKLQAKMRHLMKINDETTIISIEKFEHAMQKINQHLSNNQYLVGNKFSRADLTLAALLAPLFKPDGYGLEWPEIYPEPLQSFVDSHSSELIAAQKLYERYR